MKILRISVFVVLAVTLISCATYYKRTLKFQEYVANGNIEKADAYLEKDTKTQEGRNRILYLFHKGWTDFMLENHEESNSLFEEADRMIEDQQRQFSKEALALMTNPMVKPYKPEDFEIVLVNYFKAINYLQLNKLDQALVEAKKINIKLNQLNDKYKENKNHYSKDAFAHLLIGLIYDANRLYNDAFIAYRNAYEAYKSLYATEFGISAPEQLKKDILRTAYLTGFFEEVRFYENEFGIKYNNSKSSEKEIVFLWHNGFGPVKSEWSINFSKLDGEGGFVTLANEDMGLNFPIYIGDKPKNEQSAFEDLRFMRIAFPKYEERKPVFENSVVRYGGETYNLEMAQDINSIAFKTLHDRMLREISKSILRLATKKALELAARKEDEALGAAVGIVNALTEKADTRNWQTLPYSISYTRFPVKSGTKEIKMSCTGKNSRREYLIPVVESNKSVSFQTFHTLESFGVHDFVN